MSVSNGQKANQLTFNDAFLSRINDSDTIAKVDLNNQATDPASGTDVQNIQRELNGLNSLINNTSQVNQPATRKPNWASNAIGAPGDAVKERVDAVQAAVQENTGDLAQVRLTTGTADEDEDMGAYTPGSNGFSITDDQSTKTNIQELVDGVDARILLSEKGAANGVATLDAGGRMPAAQLPASATEYKGAWDASTNTPSLANGVGDIGDLYRVSAQGSVDFGAGAIQFYAGDAVIYNGTIWERIPSDDLVESVNGLQGVVVLDTDDISEGATNLYYTDARADARIGAASIDDLSDVDTTTTPPVADQALVWDGSQWIPQDQTGSGGGGASGTIYFEDRNADDIAKILLYNDGVVTEPVDGDGGTPTITKALNTTTAIIGDNCYRISKGSGDKTGEGFNIETDIALDANVLAGEPITVQFRYRTSSDYNSGDVRLFAYLVGTNKLVALNGIDNRGVFGNELNAETGDRGQFTGTVQAESTTTSVRILGHIATGNTDAYDLDIDEITIGTASTLTAPIVTDWEVYTPSIAGATGNSFIDFEWRRVGDTLEVRGRFNIGSANTSTAALGIPSGLTIQTNGGNREFVGNYVLSNSGANLHKKGSLLADNNTSSIYFGRTDYTVGLGSTALLLGNQVLSNGQTMHMQFKVKIQEWASSSNIVSQTQANFQAGGVHARNSASQSIPNASWTTRTGWTEDRDDLGEFNASTGVFTALKSGWYHFEFSSDFANNATGQRIVALWLNDTQERIAYGEQLPDSTFATVINCSITYYLEKGETVYPKVQQSSGGNLSTNANSATNYFSAIYIPDLSVIGLAGQKDEYLEASLVSGFEATTSAIDTYVDSSTLQLTLTPGTWDLGYSVSTRFNLKSNSGCHINTAIRDGSNNVISNSLSHVRLETVQNIILPLSGQVRLTVTSNTTYKVSLRCSLATALAEARIESEDVLGALTDPDGSSYIWARRVK